MLNRDFKYKNIEELNNMLEYPIKNELQSEEDMTDEQKCSTVHNLPWEYPWYTMFWGFLLGQNRLSPNYGKCEFCGKRYLTWANICSKQQEARIYYDMRELQKSTDWRSKQIGDEYFKDDTILDTNKLNWSKHERFYVNNI